MIISFIFKSFKLGYIQNFHILFPNTYVNEDNQFCLFLLKMISTKTHAQAHNLKGDGKRNKVKEKILYEVVVKVRHRVNPIKEVWLK